VARALLLWPRMRFARRVAALGVCALAGAVGCGQDEILPDLTDAAIDAEVDAEENVPPSPAPLGPEWALRAIEFLDSIENGLPDHLINGGFPVGTEAATPQPTCCIAPSSLCVPNPAAWEGTPAAPSLWDQLGNVRIEVPHAYVYDATSTSDALSVHAWGDLDCDGTGSILRMECTLTDGVVTCTLALPALLD
jgi:hypothetical protein